jgi:hypothetical protein
MDSKLGKKVRSSGSNSNVGRYIYTDTGKGKLRLSFLKLIVRALLPTTASSGTSDRCTRYMAHALQRAPSGKLKSPHLNYSPDREFRIKETKRAHKAMLKPQDTVVARRVVIANGGGVPHIPDWVGQIPRKYPSERLLHSQH